LCDKTLIKPDNEEISLAGRVENDSVQQMFICCLTLVMKPEQSGSSSSV